MFLVGVSVVGGVVLVLAILYWRFMRAQVEGANALTEATQDALDAANAEFVADQKEERRADEAEAAAVTDVPGAVDFLRNSFGSRKGPKL